MSFKQFTVPFILYIILLINHVSYAQAIKNDISTLTNIANLKAESYLDARNQFLISRNNPVDVNDAINTGWKQGLLALIINARIDEPKWFEGWDKTSFRNDIVGTPRWIPNPYPRNIKQIQYLNLFRTEILWKFIASDPNTNKTLESMEAMRLKGIWPKDILDEQIQRFVSGGAQVPENPKLWQKIASETDDFNMMIISYQSLTKNDDNKSKDLLESKLKSKSVNKELKMAIIAGLNFNEPDYAASVLLKTYYDWQKVVNSGFAYQAFMVFAKQPIDSNSYQFLKDILLDESISENIRKPAISSLIVGSDPNDYVITLRNVLKNSSSIAIRRAAAFRLSNSPHRISGPILQDALEKETDPYIIEQGIRVLGLPQNSEAILSRMQELLEKDGIPNETIIRAKTVIKKISEEKKK